MKVLLDIENTKAKSLLDVLNGLPYVKTKKITENPSSEKVRPSGLSLREQYKKAKKESGQIEQDYKEIDGENWEEAY
jgi:hypothetical protein